MKRVRPGDTVRMRASGLSTLFDDSLRWASSVLDGVKGKTYGRSHLGSAVHFGTADFDRERLLPDGNPSARDAVEAFLEFFHNDAGVHWTDIEKPWAEKMGRRLVSDYCTEISPHWDFVAVEVMCEPLLLTMPNGIIFELTGTTDRVYRIMRRGGEPAYGVMDFKSGSRIIGQDGEVNVDVHGPQLGEYELLETMAASGTGFPISLPAVVMGLSTQTGEIKWRLVSNPRSLLFGNATHMGYLEAASRIIADDIFVGNPRSMLCSEQYCAIYDSCFYRTGREGR